MQMKSLLHSKLGYLPLKENQLIYVLFSNYFEIDSFVNTRSTHPIFKRCKCNEIIGRKDQQKLLSLFLGLQSNWKCVFLTNREKKIINGYSVGARELIPNN